MKLLDGKKTQEKIAKLLASKIGEMKEKPVLAIVQVGDSSASSVYINQKVKFGEKIGVRVEVFKIGNREQKTENREEYLKRLISNLNEDDEITGIIVQLPLPDGLDPKVITNFIDSNKDVDGLTEGSRFVPATTKGIKTLLDEYNISIDGKKITVIGRSDLVGKPTAKYLEANGALVTVCHSQTVDIATKARGADILISATGQKGLVSKDFVKEGQVVVDVGINKMGDKLHGDVDFDEASKIVSYISPVPGGVGPMTVLSLFENLVDATNDK
jgi:methylenetetrahydrofolate dehydrogenase (NADP+) / methenyltetrahydrofolate cyclohydrolase